VKVRFVGVDRKLSGPLRALTDLGKKLQIKAKPTPVLDVVIGGTCMPLGVVLFMIKKRILAPVSHMLAILQLGQHYHLLFKQWRMLDYLYSLSVLRSMQSAEQNVWFECL
jgi:hypothetical protein